jgi:hypothetical protein
MISGSGGNRAFTSSFVRLLAVTPQDYRSRFKA